MCLLREKSIIIFNFIVAIFPNLPGSTATQVIIDFIGKNTEMRRLMTACITSLSSLKAK